MHKLPGSQKSPGQVLGAYSRGARGERGGEPMRMKSQPNPNPGNWELAVDPIREAPRQGELLMCNATP